MRRLGKDVHLCFAILDTDLSLGRFALDLVLQHASGVLSPLCCSCQFLLFYFRSRYTSVDLNLWKV